MKQTLQDMRNALHAPTLWVSLGAVILVLGLAGPFGTYSALPLMPRFAYWAGVVMLTYLSGWFISSYTLNILSGRNWPLWRMALLAGLAVGTVISTQVLVLNWAVFGLPPTQIRYALGMALNTLIISVVVTGVTIWANRRKDPGEPSTTRSGPPRIVLRLAPDKRGALISLSVQDHYVEIVTTRGRDIVLMRLADAISDTEGCAGLQVHRSHWVALDHVTAARREGARGVLTLSDGRDVPVSRTYLPSLRDAGLL